MRNWKIGIATAAAVATVAASIIVLSKDGPRVGDPAGAATPNPAMMAMPVPVAKIVRKTVPDLPGLFGTHGIDPQHRTAGQGLRLYQAAVRCGRGGRRRKGICSTPSIRAIIRRRSINARAQLQRDEAALSYARGNLDRGSSLAKSGFLAKDTFDQRNSAVGQGEATLAMSQAAVRTAELNLGYTQIRAPFAGRLGRNQAPVGTLITAGGAPLNTLVQLNPIYVTFNPSEADLAEIQKARAAGKVRSRGSASR